MKKLSRYVGPLVILWVCSSLTLAHPGHGVDGPTHYVTEPNHQLEVFAWVVAIALLVGALIVKSRRAKFVD